MTMADSSLSFVPTRGSAARNIAVQYKEVVYTNPSKRKKSNHVRPICTDLSRNADDHTLRNSDSVEIDMKRARYDVKKFARTNSESSDKQKTLRELAIELGARPKRRKAINYKDLLAEKDKEKAETKRREEMRNLDQMFDGKSMLKKKHKPVKKNRSGLLNIYGNAKVAAKSI